MKKRINELVAAFEVALDEAERDQDFRELAYACGELQAAAETRLCAKQRRRAGRTAEADAWADKSAQRVKEAQRYGEP